MELVKSTHSKFIVPKKSLIKIGACIIAFAYAFLLANLDLSLFKDLPNYERLINNLDNRKALILENNFLFFEPLFFAILYILDIFFNAKTIIRIIIFFNSFTIAYKTLTGPKTLFLGALVFLMTIFQPQIFALQLVTIRQGLGLALFLWRFPYFKSILRMGIFMFLMGLIHNSFFIISGFLFLYHFLEKINGDKLARNIVIILVLSLIFNLLLFVILEYITVRQAFAYKNFKSHSSGAAFMLFLIVLIYLYVLKKDGYKDNKFIYLYSVIGLSIYITSYFLTPIAGRIIGSFIPLIYVSILTKACMKDLYFAVGLLFLNIFLFINGGAEAFMVGSISDLFQNIVSLINFIS